MTYYFNKRIEDSTKVDDKCKFIDGDLIDSNLNLIKRRSGYLGGVLYLDTRSIYKLNNKITQFIFKTHVSNMKFVANFDIRKPEFRELYSLKRDIYVIVKFEHWYDKLPVCTVIKAYKDTNTCNYESTLLTHLNLNIKPSSFIPNKDMSSKASVLRTIPSLEVGWLTKSTSRISRSKYNVTVIDPPNCTDADDAFHYEELNNGFIIGIHITDTTSIKNISGISSIYPSFNDTIHLLHTKVLSKYTLSSGSYRDCISLICTFTNGNVQPVVKFELSNVYIENVHTYDDVPDSLNKMMISVNEWMFNIYGNVCPNDDIASKSFITYLALLYNESASKYTCIVRSQSDNSYVNDSKIPQEISNIIKYRNMNAAMYVLKDNEDSLSCEETQLRSNVVKSTHHATLNLDTYTHATSPMRRIVDHMNQQCLYNHINDVSCHHKYDYASGEETTASVASCVGTMSIHPSSKLSSNARHPPINDGFLHDVNFHSKQLRLFNRIMSIRKNVGMILDCYVISNTDVTDGTSIYYVGEEELIDFDLYSKVKIRIFLLSKIGIRIKVSMY